MVTMGTPLFVDFSCTIFMFLSTIIVDNEGKICYNILTSIKEKSTNMAATMKKARHSETRDIIYNYLCGTKAHPSAEMIFNDLKSVLPQLSLKTVYTNLRFFEERGQVIRVANVNGIERYDANCEDHVHLVCDECGAVIDIMDADIKKVKKACQVGQAKIKSIQIVLHGTCESCSV